MGTQDMVRWDVALCIRRKVSGARNGELLSRRACDLPSGLGIVSSQCPADTGGFSSFISVPIAIR